MSKRIVGMLIALSVLIPFSSASASDPWTDYENFTVIDQDTTWSGHLTRADMPKETVVVNGATLTILPGTEVEVGMLSVYDGRIVALGTATEPIRFTKQTPDYSNVPADYAPYDRECYFFSELGTVKVATEVGADTAPSVFRNVVFEGMGQNEWIGSNNCPWHGAWAKPVQEFFIKTARAERRFVYSPVLLFWYGKVEIENATFQNNASTNIETGLYFTDEWESYDWLKVIDSNFRGNSQQVAVFANNLYEGDQGKDFSGRVLLRNNWYSDASGPTTPKNPSGTGMQLSGMFELDGWSTTPFSSACTTDCFSSVLFLPGLQASRLYRPGDGDDDPLWEPGSNSEVEQLFLDSAGDSLYDDIYTRDVIDNAYVIAKGNIYQSFLEDLDDWKNSEQLIADYAVAPYDWRLTLDEILTSGKVTSDHISYLDDTDTPHIISELRRLAETSRTGKVTLIAHSNGGLLAKALSKKLGAEAGQLIDQIVLVAVPQSGTPQAIGAVLHGFDQGLPVDWFPFAMNPRTARIMAQNMPSGYNLLPSEEYFTGEGSGVETPVIKFDSGALTDAFIDKYGDKIDGHSELHDFLVDTAHKVSADDDHTASPSRVNTGLLLYADNVKQMLDDWTPPAGVAVHQIAGFGEETLSTVKYWTGVECKFFAGRVCLEYEPKLQYTPEMVVDGDGTVVVPSALAMSEEGNVSRWWVDLASYDTLSVIGRKHAGILEVPQLRNFIKENIITNESSSLPEFISDYEPPVEDSLARLEYYLHSPLALSARDSEGRIVSAKEDTYPGARYRHFGEVQYLSVPAESHPTIILDGLADGSFTLEVKEVEGRNTVENTTFAGVMTSPDTEVTMSFPDGTIAEAEPLTVDYDGDGTAEIMLEPQPGETVMPEASDATPPVTTATLAGTMGIGGWYTSDVTVTLTATDPDGGSGVEQTEYSLDNGTTWSNYTAPITLATEGTTTLQYFSTDKANNQEVKKTETIQIDKVAPEGKVAFNPTTQKLDITGTDNLGGPVTVIMVEQKKDLVATNTKLNKINPWFERWLKRHKKNLPDMLATLTDEAGHTTSISFEKTKDRKGYVFVRVRSLGYDDSETVPTEAQAQYKWRVDRKNQYQQLASALKVGDVRLESRYIPRINETWIMERPQDLGDDERDDESERRPVKQKIPGMVMPYLLTKQGTVMINY